MRQSFRNFGFTILERLASIAFRVLIPAIRKTCGNNLIQAGFAFQDLESADSYFQEVE
ncbi:MAG: hypothetical protein K8T89_04505 [Planctomycetes bacterium]|nr:hypothetical protein [Planctomycetota bacterium]